MKILFIGDIVGRPGRDCLFLRYQKIKDKFGISFSIVNVENAAGGFGITPKIADSFLSLGIDVMTSGNHIWDKKEIIEYIKIENRLLRPANYPSDVPGRGGCIAKTANGLKVGVLNLCGRVFMDSVDCPFRIAESEIAKLKNKTNILIVDFHAEATSEKIAMGWFLNGKVSAVIGTHTHVRTCDAQILSKGTAYITDVGMTGPFDSVIGIEKEIIIERFLSQMPKRFVPAKGDIRLSAVIIDIDEKSGKALSIHPLENKVYGNLNLDIEENGASFKS